MIELLLERSNDSGTVKQELDGEHIGIGDAGICDLTNTTYIEH